MPLYNSKLFFAIIKYGIVNEIEMLLLCFAFNINKLHKKTIKKRRNTHLFEKMIA